MFMAVGAASSALSYLQSLLAQGTAGIGSTANTDPLSSLLGGLSGAGSDGDTSKAPAGTTGSAAPAPSFDPGTMAALLALQSQSAGGAQAPLSLFAKLDTDGNGQISQSEFETTLGNAGVDKSSADALFATLDANGDGSIDQSELSKARHGGGHHHHMHAGGGAQGSGSSGADALVSGADAAGTTTQTTTNADGSSTTTISYADGSTVEMTTPAAPSNGSGSGNGATGQNSANLIERLIQMQAQLASAVASTTSTVA
ncbi:MAG TPA: EF-hand domain-containing protein [Pseudolabrys sp.]|nr:EF-hand domain-containing protein [Pseudolabrys sp.]